MNAHNTTLDRVAEHLIHDTGSTSVIYDRIMTICCMQNICWIQDTHMVTYETTWR